jgi:excisionase family DNA binding protein
MRKLATAAAPSGHPLIYSTEEARAILKIGRSTMIRLVLSGELRSITIGRRRLISVQALEAFIRQREDAQGGDAA